MTKIAIVVGSTRPGRVGAAVADWVYLLAGKRDDADFELVDIADYDLPLLDEPMPASFGQPYQRGHTSRWSGKIAEFDGYVFVTPEYNHGVPAALKNAIDFLYHEWTNKAAGFVAYGGNSGVRVIEQLREVTGALQIADVCATVNLSLFTDFESFTVFQPGERREQDLTTMLDQVIAWSRALQSARAA